MIGRTVIFFIAALCLAEARVDFNHSRIYDEFDFQGQSSVVIYGLCKDTCRIYASITEESKKLASNLLFQTSTGFISIADVAAKFDPSTKQKAYIEFSYTPNLKIVNTNPQFAAGPLVLYVVNQAADFFSTAEVYEAAGFHRPVSTLVQALTVMNARPFTLTQARHEGELAGAQQGVVARMAGFDALASDSCAYLYSLSYGPFPGFTLEVNGPVVSLKYDLNQSPVPPGDLSATIGISNERDLEKAGWMGSPGYHGCIDKQPYRSSLYDTSSLFHGSITMNQPEYIWFDVVTNTDATHPVLVIDPPVVASLSIDDAGEYPFDFGMTFQNVTVRWMPDGTGHAHFMIRWNSTMIPL